MHIVEEEAIKDALVAHYTNMLSGINKQIIMKINSASLLMEF